MGDPSVPVINKMRLKYTTEYDSALKRKAGTCRTWMILADFTLSERSQTHRDQWRIIPLIGGVWKSEIHGARCAVVAGGGWEERALGH